MQHCFFFGAGRRWLVLVSLIFCAGLPLRAQLISQYALTVSNGTYTDLTGSTPLALNQVGTGTDDNYSAALPLPFAFRLGAQAVSAYVINTNGWLTFGPGGVDPYNVPLSRSRNQLVAFLGMDLTAQQAVYSSRVLGTAPNRIFQIEAKNITEYGVALATGNVQIWLYEGSNTVEMHYGAFSADWTNGTASGAQVGLRGNDTTDVRSVSGSWATPVANTSSRALLALDGALGDLPANGLILTFALPTGVDFTAPTIAPLTLTPAGAQCRAVPHTVTTTVTDATGLARVELLVRVAGAAPIVQPMAPQAPGSSVYEATVPATVGAVTVQVRAVDTSPNANTGTSAVIFYQDALLTLDAGPDQIINAGSSATLQATSSREVAVRITEFTMSRAGVGATTSYPPYVPATAGDFLEITNLTTTVANLAGYGLEVLSAGLAAHTYAFPPNTTLDPRRVLLLHLGTGRDSAEVGYYNTGAATDALFSGSSVAFVLSAPDGRVLDAVVVNAFVPTSPIGALDWIGPGVVSASGVAGASLRGADLDNATNWAGATAAQRQTLGAINAGLPTLQPPTPVIWTGGLLSTPSAGSLLITPGHPTPGVYQYVASTTDGTCTVTDTVRVTAIVPGTLVPDFSADTANIAVGDVVTLTDRTFGIPTDWRWRLTPMTGITFVNNTSAISQNPQVQVGRPGRYTVTMTVDNGTRTDSVTKIAYLNVGLRYCVAGLQTAPCSLNNGFIDSVVIAATTLRSVATGCASGTTAPGYTAYPQAGATTAELARGQAYELQVTTSGRGSVAAWIDFNNDGVYDSTEYLSITTQARPNVAATLVFTVPDSAVLTATTGLRLRNAPLLTNGIGGANACTARANGETEDYRVKLVAAPNAVPADYAAAGLVVYPNPSTGLVRVRLSGPGLLTVRDALGRVVHTQAATAPETVLPLGHLPAGLYGLSTELGGRPIRQRLVLTR